MGRSEPSGLVLLNTSLHPASFIPEGNNVIVPTYALQRDPRYFSPHSNGFWPDRWLKPEERKEKDDITRLLGDHVEVVLDSKAFIPFSTGPRSCVGKPLALTELRVVTSYLVQRFDIVVAEGFNMNDWERDLQDHFVMKKRAFTRSCIS